jgi:hypothetical protein
MAPSYYSTSHPLHRTDIRTLPPLDHPEQACTLANPHSSAFIDIDGDCLSDLVLHCRKPKSTIHTIQIWLNRGAAGYKLAQTYDLPKGSGPLSFADMSESHLQHSERDKLTFKIEMGQSTSYFLPARKSHRQLVKAWIAPSISPTIVKPLSARTRLLSEIRMAV